MPHPGIELSTGRSGGLWIPSGIFQRDNACAASAQLCSQFLRRVGSLGFCWRPLLKMNPHVNFLSKKPNKRVKFARVVRPTRKSEALLLTVYAQR